MPPAAAAAAAAAAVWELASRVGAISIGSRSRAVVGEQHIYVSSMVHARCVERQRERERFASVAVSVGALRMSRT